MKRFYKDNGFTLIELLTVIVIILILTGLIAAVYGYIQNRAARERARAEIQSFENALERYKEDNGGYPDDGILSGANTYLSGTCAKLNPRTMGNPTSGSYAGTGYSAASLVLYRALSGDRDCDGVIGNGDKLLDIDGSVLAIPLPALPTIYVSFKPGQLKTANGSTIISSSNKVTGIADPFGYSYGYSTAYNEYVTYSGTSILVPGYNQTCDIWSTAGNLADPPASGTDNVTPTWVTNW